MFRRIPRWDELNRLGRSRLLQSSYVWLLLVPMAAKALSAIDDPLILKGIAEGLRIHLTLPFSWRLFYFSAVTVSIAGAIYSFFCPKLVRTFGNYAEYRSEGRGREYLLRYAKEQMHQEDTFEAGFNGGALNDEVTNAKEEKEFAELFWRIHSDENLKSPYLRAACFLFYSVGLVLIAIVLVQNFIFVIEELW